MIYQWQDIIDIIIVAFVFYQLFLLIKGTKAVQMFLGLAVLIIISAIAQFLQLTLVSWLLKLLWSFWVIAFIVLFQPELRDGLARIGENRFLQIFLKKEHKPEFIEEIVEAIEFMANKKTGALIVIERKTGLRNFVETGTKISGEISMQFLITLFFPHSPLHDGAVIIKDREIVAAGCILPLTKNPNVEKTLGMRHRAGLGITEETDAIAIIVSEETGDISFVIKGTLTKLVDSKMLSKILNNLLK